MDRSYKRTCRNRFGGEVKLHATQAQAQIASGTDLPDRRIDHHSQHGTACKILVVHAWGLLDRGRAVFHEMLIVYSASCLHKV